MKAEEECDSIMDMDPRIRWERLFNYLKDMEVRLHIVEGRLLQLIRYQRKTPEEIQADYEAALSEISKMKMGEENYDPR